MRLKIINTQMGGHWKFVSLWLKKKENLTECLLESVFEPYLVSCHLKAAWVFGSGLLGASALRGDEWPQSTGLHTSSACSSAYMREQHYFQHWCNAPVVLQRLAWLWNSVHEKHLYFLLFQILAWADSWCLIQKENHGGSWSYNKNNLIIKIQQTIWSYTLATPLFSWRKFCLSGLFGVSTFQIHFMSFFAAFLLFAVLSMCLNLWTDGKI